MAELDREAEGEPSADLGRRRVRRDELAAAFGEGWNVTGIAADAFAINPGFGTPAAGAWLATIRRL